MTLYALLVAGAIAVALPLSSLDLGCRMKGARLAAWASHGCRCCNALQFPRAFLHLKFTEWARIHGEIYSGYLIPKGSTIFMDTWGLFHDPNLFEDPEKFEPARYLDSPFGVKAGVDTTHFRENLMFGAGRRICPGEYMASRTVALTVMNLIWAFDFSKNPSKHNKPSLGIEDYAKPGLALTPLPFTLSVAVRNAARAKLIKATLENNFVH